MGNHLFDAIREAARSDAVFMEVPGDRVWRYGEVLAVSAQLAHAMTKRGVQVGDRVAVQVEKSAEALVLYLACIRCGAIYLPLNTAYTLAELTYFLEDAEPRLVVVAPSVRDAVAGIAGDAAVETLDTEGGGSLLALAANEPKDFADVAREADDIAAILYTSGTTGRSKGAMLTHDNLLSNALTLKDYWGVTSQDRLIHALPIFHTHGLFVATNVMLLAGASMFILPRFDLDEILPLMARATMMMGVPTFYTRLLQSPKLDREVAADMRLFISGSAPLLAETHKAFEERTGHAILERYGMTETGMNTSNPYRGERIAGTVGFALPEVTVRITDPENGSPLPDGEIGMMEIKGPNVFKGYWRMPEKTAAEFTADGFFTSGDLGKRDAQGYLHIVGRQKDLIISGGFNIYPKEIETEIDNLDGVKESAVIGVAHPDFGEGVTAVVVRKPGAKVDEASVLAALKDRLARYKLPKRVLFVEELPRNAMGKVQKQALRERNAKLYQA